MNRLDLLLIQYQLMTKNAIADIKASSTHVDYMKAKNDLLHSLSSMPTIDRRLYNAVDEVLNELLPDRRMRLEDIGEEDLERMADWERDKKRILPILDMLNERGLAI